jgi:DNA-binding protein H-NS
VSDFLQILGHTRRLDSATKSLSTKDLRDVISKLEAVIEKRELQAQEEAAKLEEKKAQIERIRQQMIEAGLDISDFDAQYVQKKSKNTRRRGAKRPIKYAMTVDGQEHKWTGIGRMPVVFRDAIERGAELESFAV